MFGDRREVLVAAAGHVDDHQVILRQLGREVGDLGELREAGGTPEHLVKLTIFVSDVADYLAHRPEIGKVWRERLGKLPPGKGLGMACSHYVSGAAKPIHRTGEPHAVVNLKLDFDGGVTALTGAADIGQQTRPCF